MVVVAEQVLTQEGLGHLEMWDARGSEEGIGFKITLHSDCGYVI